MNSPEISEPDIFIIGGLPRTGKSTLAWRVQRRLEIFGIQTDHMRAMFNKDEKSWISSDPSLKIKKITRLLRPYIEGLLENQVKAGSSIVFEGEAIAPAMIAESPYAHLIKSCFLGHADAELAYYNIREHAIGNDWTARIPNNDLMAILQKYVRRSQVIEEECDRLGLPYFEVSTNYPQAHMEAYMHLISGNYFDYAIQGAPSAVLNVPT